MLTRPRRRIRRVPGCLRREADCRGVRRGVLDLVDGTIEQQQRRPCVNLGVDDGKDLSHPPGSRSAHRRLHLHAFEHGDRRSGLNLVACRDVDHHHHRRRRCADHSGLVPHDPVTDPVDLDQVIGPAGHRHDVEACLAEPEPAFEAAQAVDVDVDESPVHLQPVSTGTDLSHFHPIGPRSVAELDLAARRVAGPWPTATRGAEEGISLERLLGVVGIDGNAEQSDVGVTSGCFGHGSADTVQPARVRLNDPRSGRAGPARTPWSSCRPGSRSWSRAGHNASEPRPPSGPSRRR